ncbi:MAG: RNA polymerase factor sigma-32 [Polyangiaceae bacterium]|nr:RNA polymerase factor sigma-32 [Polyangiaceae bacterium]
MARDCALGPRAEESLTAVPKKKKPVVVEAKPRPRDPDDDDADDAREDDAEGETVIDAAAELVEGDDDAREGDDDAEDQDTDGDVKDVGSEVALSRHDPLQAYLREVQRHRVLSADEQHALAVKYLETADVDAARKLVTTNLRLVVKIAYEYRRAYKNIMDLIQEGNIGLMQAVKKYDPYRGVKLSSYSAWWIRAYILRFIVNNWRLVKLGTTQAQRKLFFNLNKEKARLLAMGIDPTAEEVAKRLGVAPEEALEMERRLSSAEASLDAPVGDNEGRAVARVELLPGAGPGPDATVEGAEIGDIVRDRLGEFRKTLKGKELIIFDKRLVAEEPLTLQELGDEFGVSRERVRQLEARLTSNLRVFLKDALGDAVSVS